MDSDHTQHALDALADLFLTGLEPGGESAALRAQAAAERKAPRPQDGRSEAALDGPAPIRLAPKITPPRPAPEPFHPDDALPGPEATPFGDAGVFDEDTGAPTADQPFLRLRRDAEEDAAAPAVAIAPRPRPQPAHAAPAAPPAEAGASDDDGDGPTQPVAPSVLVEAALLGNLPGMGGPWLTQYAQLLASQEGPVALLHVGDDEVDLELVQAEDARHVPRAAAGDDLLSVLRSLVTRKTSPVRSILVHIDVSADRTTVDRLLGLDRWTLLCGADDAAVVSVYRVLKQLADADAAAGEKRVGVMLMGSDEGPSRAAFGRIASAAQNFLQRPVQLVGWQKRVGPANVHRLGTYPNLNILWPRLQAFLATLPASPSPASAQPPSPTPDHPHAPSSNGASVAARPRVAEPAEADHRHDAPDVATTRTRQAPRPAASSRLAPEPSVVGDADDLHDAPTPAEPPVDEDTPDLAALLIRGRPGIPGGVALDARCPHHPHTQLLLDQTGRLHLLRRVTTGDEGSNGASSEAPLHALRAAILDLIETRRWVQEHRDLLQLTQRQLRIDPAARPAIHLFTDRADLATGLAARLGDTLKLHLLQQVRVGVHATWFCVPLS